MSLQKRLLVTLMLSASLVACGGGGGSNNNLFNPEESEGTTADDTDTSTDGSGTVGDTSDTGGLVLFGTEYAGFFLEDPYFNPEDQMAGGIYFKTDTRPDEWEDGSTFDGVMSFKFQSCQKDNIVGMAGLQADEMSGSWGGQIDGVYRNGGISPMTFDEPIIKASYSVDGGRIHSVDSSIAGCTVDHYLSPQGKIELYPLNSTHYGSDLTYSSVLSMTGNVISWNYDGSSNGTSTADKITISLIDKTAADSGITSGVFLWQDVVDGDVTSYTFPDSVNLVANTVYVVAVTAYTPTTYGINFHTNLEFTAD